MAEASDFGPLVQLAEEFIKEYSFELLDPLGNRHGSWEVTFHRSPAESPESNGYLDRFVSLAFTSLPAAVSSRGLYEVEVWAGADNGDQFTRHLTSIPILGYALDSRRPYILWPDRCTSCARRRPSGIGRGTMGYGSLRPVAGRWRLNRNLKRNALETPPACASSPLQPRY